MFLDFGRFREDFKICVGISVHEPYSPLDTIFNYMFYLDLQENIYKQVEKTDYLSAGEVRFGDLSIDIFLEVQNTTYT